MSYDAESQDERSPQSPDPLLTIETKPLGWASRKTSRRRWFETRYGRLCITLGLLCFTLLGTSYLVTILRGSGTLPYTSGRGRLAPWVGSFADNSVLLNSRKPTSRFRDNLRASDAKFITAWPSSGWTNDVMAAMNLVYMGMLTGRVPVIPPFTPSHVGSMNEVGPIAFRDVFDVQALAYGLGIHILEWDDLKNPAIAAATNMNVSSEVERLGCWSTWMLNKVDRERPRDSAVPQWYNLDVSYTPVPPSFTLSHGHQKDQYYTSLWSLASLAYPKSRDWAWATQRSRTLPTATDPKEPVEPDDRMLCFDLLYYIGLANEEEAMVRRLCSVLEICGHPHALGAKACRTR
ncbi:hypothetical protein RhiJN_14532 [Ceratobasidium sp. AG-Ba]|nr:hypothetical protein RhiJN_14532 [Ceratobasidium sp. AG-Ba]